MQPKVDPHLPRSTQPPHLVIANDEFVGGIGAHNKDIHRFTAEIGYWIGEPH